MTITVNVGEILQCDHTEDIRTRACDPCVALIVIYKNGDSVIKKCAHFTVSFDGRLYRDSIEQALKPVLQENFPLKHIHKVGITWGGNALGLGGDLVFSCLGLYFAGINGVIVSSHNDSICSNGLDLCVSNGEIWNWSNIPASNGLAELQAAV